MERFGRVQQKVALLVLLATSSAQAQDNAKLFQLTPLPDRLVPEYIACVYKDVRYACFDAAQMVQLNTLEVQARYWHTQWEDSMSLLEAKEGALVASQKQILVHLDLERQDQDHITGLNEQLTAEIEAKNEWRSKAENPPTWPLWVGGAAGILGLGAFLSSLAR